MIAQTMPTLGQRASEGVKRTVGSWRFLIIQSCFLVIWLIWNGTGHGIDQFPFILLNLMLSFQAAYTGPIVMISQNRQDERSQAQIDRIEAMETILDTHVNTTASEHTRMLSELHTMITDLHTKPKTATKRTPTGASLPS